MSPPLPLTNLERVAKLERDVAKLAAFTHELKQCITYLAERQLESEKKIAAQAKTIARLTSFSLHD